MTKRSYSSSPISPSKRGRHDPSDISQDKAGNALAKQEDDDAKSDRSSDGSEDVDEEDGEDEQSEDDDFEESGVYDAGQESLPFHVAYDPSLNNMKFAVARELLGYKVFEDNGKPPLSKDMVPLLQRYEAVQNYPAPRPIIIGLIGAASAGKSSVINSILDCKNLAETGAAGSSCTNVVTEFCAALPGQQDKFSASIIYLDSSETEQLLQQHLHDVLMMQHANEENWSSGEREQGCRKIQTAATTFSTLFADLSEFGSFDTALHTLERVSEEDIDNFLRPLLSRCAKIVDKTGTPPITASSADKLNKRLSPYTQPNASSSSKTGKPGLWPLVGKVRITLKDWHVLNGLKHLVFADVPGLQDTNLIRVEGAKKYLETCDALWVVGNISRIKDNAETSALLDLAIARHQNKAALVATHADSNLSEKTFKALRDDGPESAECSNRLAKVKRIEKQLAGDTRTCKKALDRATKRQAYAMKKRLELDLEEATHQFQDALMQLRNRSVVDHMRKSTAKKFPRGARLQVFCVANDLYDKQKNLGNSRRNSSASATNIPALREHALLLPTTAIYRSDKNFITGAYQDLLTGIDAWTKNTSLHDSNAVINAIERLRETAVAQIHEHCQKIDHITETLMFDHIQRNADKYNEAAIDVSLSWKRYRWHTYRHYCGHNGLVILPNGTTGSSWNEELMAKMTQDMADTCFPMLGFQQSLEIGNVTAELVGFMRDIKTEIRNNMRDNTRFADFGAQIEAQCDKIKQLIMDDCAQQSALIRDISVHMSKDIYNSIAGRIMRPVYAKCASEHGMGTQNRMHTHMHIHMTGGKQFSHRVLALVKHKYYAARKGRGEKFAASIGEIFRKLAENVRLMASENNTLSLDPMVEQVRASMVERIAKSLILYDEMVATFAELERSASGLDI